MVKIITDSSADFEQAELKENMVECIPLSVSFGAEEYKDNVNLTIVTLNDGDDFNDHIKLYEEAFKEYENYEILKEGYVELVDEKYYPNRKFYIKESFNYILNDLEKNNIVLKFYLDKKLTYSNGEKIGYVYVYIGDKEVFKTNLYIELKKKKVRIIDIILGWFK